MLGNSQKLTEGLIIYSVLVSDYEKLDFKDDALAGVRANYFNYSKTPQKEKTEINIDGSVFNLYYSMYDGESLLWKVTRKNRPYQSVKKESGDIYCVFFYNENGVVNKRAYFDFNHNWIRTEYYDTIYNSILVCRISPKVTCGILTLQMDKFSRDGKMNRTLLFPSKDNSVASPSVLIYSNSGMIWYDTAFKPEDVSQEQLNCDDNDDTLNNNVKGFSFKPEYFYTKTDDKIDIFLAEYLSDEDLPKAKVDNQDKADISQPDKSYSAYDTIEKILVEAHKTNKSLFGEIITQTEDSLEILNKSESAIFDSISVDEISNMDNTENSNSVFNKVADVENTEISDVTVDEVSSIENNENANDAVDEAQVDLVTDDTEFDLNVTSKADIEVISNKNPTDDITTELDSLDNINEDAIPDVSTEKEIISEDVIEENLVEENTIEEVIQTETDVDKALEDNEVVPEENNFEDNSELMEDKTESVDDVNYDVCKEKNCDVVIVTKSGRYSYYGEIDDNNCRTGKGRTVTPDGLTSYDGYYIDDKRNGFGVCYYKNGNINYIGNWLDNDRNGCGVGYRLSDGTMHAGKWKSNSPDGYGARFDSNGELIDVCMYQKGIKNGKSVSFDDNGNLIISIWKDGEKISEHLVAFED